MIGEDGGAVRRANAGGVEQVLDCKPDPLARLELGDEDAV
jgi:hypothetical protein